MGIRPLCRACPFLCCDKALNSISPVPLASQIPQVGSGLIAENSFTESVKPAAFSITIRSVLHLLTPDLRESEKPGPVASPPCVYVAAEAPARTEKPQESTKFARQVVDPPGEYESVMKLPYMV